MSDNSFINILIAEDNDVTREMMAGILETRGYKILHAIDGDSAIEVINNTEVHAALVDINMVPTSGFEFIRHVVVKGLKTPIAIVTGDDSADILLEASALGVVQVIHKPINPDRLVQIVERMLKRSGINPTPMGVEEHRLNFSHEELMLKAIELAQKNVTSGKGGPYGALIADAEGKILGQGVNGIKSRIDPIAHAEVMAIRQASERLGEISFKDCTLYCSSEPTKIGHALIESVGIGKVFYGLSGEDIAQIRGRAPTSTPQYEQICKDEALQMFQSAKRPE
jgi:tRNA(Arg) A34 adenosine deaminase TadA/CheY-like chemotaxis protein